MNSPPAQTVSSASSTRLPGVTATANDATEKAKVSHGGDVATDDSAAVVEFAW